MPQSILFVGNLVQVKAPERVLAACAEIAEVKPDVSLEIVGDGALRSRLEGRAVDLGIEQRVRFHGRQPPSVVADMMRAATCLCLTSRSEGMPNVVVEALACGTPVVATAVGEVPFLIQDGVNGVVVGRTESPSEGQGRSEEQWGHEIATALLQVLDTEWDPRTIARTVDGFTWEAAAQVIIDAIQSVDAPT